MLDAAPVRLTSLRAGDSPPLIVVHGFMQTSRAWRDTVEHMAARRCVIGVELPGHHPLSPALPGESFLGAVDRIAAALSRAGLCAAHLAGYSMGGRVALALAAAHGWCAQRVTLIGARDGLASRADADERDAQEAAWRARLAADGQAAFAEWWEGLPLFASQARATPEALERQRAERAAHDPAQLAAALGTLGLAGMPRVGDAIGRIRADLELIAGEEDARFARIAERLAARHPRADVHILPECGHNPLLEAPRRLARLLDRSAGQPN